MTLKEIADEVGVSVSTVSRVVNTRNPHAASPELQQAIWECVRKNGYVPSSVAKKSKSFGEDEAASKTPVRLVACVFARNSKSVSENTYFSGMAKCFEKTSLALHYSTGSYFTAIELNERHLETLADKHLDGIVIMGRHDQKLIDRIKGVVDHIIYTGLARPASEEYDAVICDRYEIGKKAAEYLHGLGHKKIAYLGETEGETTFDAFKTSLSNLGAPIAPHYVMSIETSMESGYQGMKRLLAPKDKPTAVFCMNDYVAIGALRAAHECGVRCPEDISILGVDDIEPTNYTTPRLTTIQTPMAELGTIAAKILIDRIEGGHTIPLKVMLPFKIIERESCLPPRA